MSLMRVGDLFNLEKGSLQSSKNIEGEYDFITAAEEWKTNNEYSHECEALIFAAAASGSLGRTHYVNGKFISSDLCFILTPKNEKEYPIDLKFYHFVFNSLKEKIVKNTKTGTSKESINQTNLKNYEIPYFGIEQQHLWIEKLINTKSIKEDLENEISNQQNLLTKLKQSILQEATRGRLTSKWREQNQDIEPVSVLLEKILAEKEKLIKEKKIKKSKPLAEISEDEIPFVLPKSWEFSKLDNLVYLTRGSSPRPIQIYITEKEDGVNWIKIGDTKNINKYIYKTEQKITPEGAEKSQPVEENDFILSNSMSFGKPFIMKTKGFIHDGWFLIRTIYGLDLDYFYYLLSSSFIQKQFLTSATGAVVKNIKGDIVKNTILTLPPLEEQKEIVNKIEKLFVICDKLEEQINSSKQNTQTLMQAVLKEVLQESTQETNTNSIKLPTLQEKEDKYFVKRKMLASYIINQSLNDTKFGDVKFEKLLFLADYYCLQRNFGQEYKQKAAGPFDNTFTYPFFQQTLKSNWFKKEKCGKLNRIIAGNMVEKSKNTYNYFSQDELNKINQMIDWFKNCNYEQPEIVATLYAVWNNRIINKQEINNELLKQDFLDWDKSKNKYKDKLDDAINWMRENNIVPNGWGLLINKPKNQK
jgi:type I restriction enzyme S subunit